MKEKAGSTYVFQIQKSGHPFSPAGRTAGCSDAGYCLRESETGCSERISAEHPAIAAIQRMFFPDHPGAWAEFTAEYAPSGNKPQPGSSKAAGGRTQA